MNERGKGRREKEKKKKEQRERRREKGREEAREERINRLQGNSLSLPISLCITVSRPGLDHLSSHIFNFLSQEQELNCI